MKARARSVLASAVLVCAGACGALLPGGWLGQAAAQSAPATPPSPAADRRCDVPAYLLAGGGTLEKVAATVRERQPLNVLVIGSGSSALAAGTATAYPERLQAALRERLPGTEINIATDIQQKRAASATVEALPRILADKTPSLVIWQTGTVDAMAGADPDDFRAALDAGLEKLKAAGTDVILMNLQYSPRMEALVATSTYLDHMRLAAQSFETPLYDRFAIMRYWNEAGELDLFTTSHGPELAQKVHDCVGRSLADLIVETARINPAELRVGR